MPIFFGVFGFFQQKDRFSEAFIYFNISLIAVAISFFLFSITHLELVKIL